MKTLEQIKNFTPKQRNEFIDEMIDMLEKYWESVSIIGTLIYLSDADFRYLGKDPYTNALLINREYIEYARLLKDDSIHYLKSIKTAE